MIDDISKPHFFSLSVLYEASTTTVFPASPRSLLRDGRAAKNERHIANGRQLLREIYFQPNL